MRDPFCWRVVVLTSLVAVTRPATAQFSTGVIVEGVGNYDFWCGVNPQCCNGGCGTNCIPETDGFWTALTAPGTGYTPLVHYTDNSVWDSDFHDPDLTGYSFDSDTLYFDRAGAAVSYACGHGRCDDAVNWNCTSNNNCGRYSYCPGFPPVDPGESKVCIYEKQRRLTTASTISSHGNHVFYGRDCGTSCTQPFKSFAMGEDSSSGAFGGAGTNGGANVSFISNSCGVRSGFLNLTTYNFFAGVHSVMMLMPTAAWRSTSGAIFQSDALGWNGRGAYIAQVMLTNPSSAVKDAWLDPTHVSYSYVDLSGGTKRWGANIIIARGATQADADWHALTESWVGAKYESNDPTGRGYYRMYASCSYDCATWGM